jgi:HEAT repeat protein
MTLERYWNEFDALDEQERLRLGSQVMARTHRAWAVLNRHLSHAEPASRVRALRIVSTLGLGSSFSDQLYTLSFDPHPEVRSAAVMALGQVPGSASKRILQQAMVDPDSRVQANAVEAADDGGHAATQSLLPRLASSDNRVRANAVKALLKLGVREAAETLLHMLQHPDPRHRASALWLVEKMGLTVLTHRLVQMAAGDQDPQLRTRAGALRDRFLSASEQPAGAAS